MKKYQCSHCKVFFDENAPKRLKHLWPDIPGLLDRCEPGEPIPLGECPICGALVYPTALAVSADPKNLCRGNPIVYTVVLDTGDSRAYVQAVAVSSDTPEDERVKKAVELARKDYEEIEEIDDPEPYPAIAVFLGEVTDISTGDE